MELGEDFSPPPAFVEARQLFRELQLPVVFRSDETQRDWSHSPELPLVCRWLDSVRPGQTVEIEVVRWASIFLKSAWKALPRRTITGHRRHFNEVSQRAADLAEALREGSPLPLVLDEGFNGHRLWQLMSEEEEEAIFGVRPPSSDLDASASYSNLRYALPSLPELLDRLAQRAEAAAKLAPRHSQPNRRNAGRADFLRSMHRVLIARYGQSSVEVLASISTIVFSQTMDAELVRKLLSSADRKKRA